MKQGSVLGVALLIGGSCIGAGMLGLPMVTGLAGFFPSLIGFFLAWGFMTVTALLLVEVNSWHGVNVNLTTMAERSLGRVGKGACLLLYLFLFYSLLVAYIAGTGGIVATFFKTYLSISLPVALGSFLFTALFAFVVRKGTYVVDWWNRVLVGMKVLFYLAMVAVGLAAVQAPLLMHVDVRFAFTGLPVLIIAFGFHNLIPTLHTYLGGDTARLKKAILIGSFFSLIVYLIWNLIVLGILPYEGVVDSLKEGHEATQAVSAKLGVSLISTFAQLLGFAALLTSFLAQSLALVHFLGDALKSGGEKHESLPLCLLALLPPLFLSLFYPQIFFKALNFAGGICAVILFGLLPVLMVWKGRYLQKLGLPEQIPGGKKMLVALLLFSLFVLFFQISSMLEAPYIPAV